MFDHFIYILHLLAMVWTGCSIVYYIVKHLWPTQWMTQSMAVWFYQHYANPQSHQYGSAASSVAWLAVYIVLALVTMLLGYKSLTIMLYVCFSLMFASTVWGMLVDTNPRRGRRYNLMVRAWPMSALPKPIRDTLAALGALFNGFDQKN